MIELQQTIARLQAEVQTCRKTQSSLQHFAEVGEFAAMIVHEVLNPLTTVLMVLEDLQKMQLTEPFQERLLLALEDLQLQICNATDMCRELPPNRKSFIALV